MNAPISLANLLPERSAAMTTLYLVKHRHANAYVSRSPGSVETVPVGVPADAKRFPDPWYANAMRLKLARPQEWVVVSVMEQKEVLSAPR